VILRAMKAWDFKLAYRGREVGETYFQQPGGPQVKLTPAQLSLPLSEVIALLDERDLEIAITKKEADSVQIQVSIRFAG